MSKFAPDDTELVSSSGVSAVTTISSVIWPTSSMNGTVNCCPTPSTMLSARRGLEPCHLHGDFVGAGIEQRRLEVAGAIGHEVLADLRVDVGDLHRGAGNDALFVTNGAGDIAASFLRRRGARQQNPEKEKPQRWSHASSSIYDFAMSTFATSSKAVFGCRCRSHSSG